MVIFPMKSMFANSILIFLVTLLMGCEEAGYIIILEADQVKYNDIREVGNLLEAKHYKLVWREKKKIMSKYPNEVFTLFRKELTDKPFYSVDVYLIYVKGLSNSTVSHLRVEIENVYKGMTIDELKDEIDNVGDMIHEKLTEKLGKNKVMIERKLIMDRGIFSR